MNRHFLSLITIKNYIMKKKTIIYLLMFAFAFVLPSFSFPNDEKGSVEKTMQSTSDSVVVNVKFQNPKLIVTQNALENKLEAQFLCNKELLSVAREFNENFTKFNGIQERRYESLMARLQRYTGYSTSQINKFIKQKQTLNVVLCFGLLFYSILLIILYNTSYRRLKENIVGLIIVSLAIGSIITGCLALLWPTLMGHDYVLFYKLLELSPF